VKEDGVNSAADTVVLKMLLLSVADGLNSFDYDDYLKSFDDGLKSLVVVLLLSLKTMLLSCGFTT
jgi:hypothetical protein